MAEQEHVAWRDPVGDLRLPHLVVELVGQQDHHQVAAAGCLDDAQHLEPLLARLGDRGRGLAQADHHLHAGVLEVERVGVALGAVADDCDGLAVEQLEIRIVVVEHGGRLSESRGTTRASRSPRWSSRPAWDQANATATSERPGISSAPSGAV